MKKTTRKIAAFPFKIIWWILKAPFKLLKEIGEILLEWLTGVEV